VERREKRHSAVKRKRARHEKKQASRETLNSEHHFFLLHYIQYYKRWHNYRQKAWLGDYAESC
jgi:hypothetical protein